MLPKAVICDMDGLLLDTEHLSELSFMECCKEFGQPFNASLFGELTGQSGSAHLRILTAFMPDIAQHFDSRWKQIYHEMLADKVPVKAGIPEFLTKLQASDIMLAVATSSRTDKAKHYLKMAGIADFFCQISGSDLVAHAKPAPDIYLLTLAELQLAASSSMILEDSNNGVTAGLASGIRTIQVPDRQLPFQHFADNPLYFLAETLTIAEDFILSG